MKIITYLVNIKARIQINVSSNLSEFIQDRLASSNDDESKAISELLDIQLEEVELMSISLEDTEEEPLEKHLGEQS